MDLLNLGDKGPTHILGAHCLRLHEVTWHVSNFCGEYK